MSTPNSTLEQTGCLRRAQADRPALFRPARSSRAFTLIELLVVISIIGVLAGLILGLSGLAGRKSKESRIRTDMMRIGTDIENYKSALGFYPPDNPGRPSTNQLFYELSGTVYANNQFYLPGRLEPISPPAIQNYFGSAGVANAARDPKDLKFIAEFKASQYARISANPAIDVLVSPVKGLPYGAAGSWTLRAVNGQPINPWLYVSTSPTNNPDRFDLWTEVVVGGKLIRFSNWEKDPVVIR